MSAKIAVVMGSDSDWKVMKAAYEVIEEFGVPCHKQVLSAHRTPLDLPVFTKMCMDQGIKIIIAGAGGAAHLPGMLASMTTLPVIGVPVNTTAFSGLDSLLSIVQMPKGIPVATVAVDNAYNSGLLALRILSLEDSGLQKKLQAYQEKIATESREKTSKLT
jgi:5-(carboxyamino)imidazole ribonucleotide mutase